jgi:hypothetical protein
MTACRNTYRLLALAGVGVLGLLTLVGSGGGGGDGGGGANAPFATRTYLKASNTGGGDHFGFSVAFSADGNTLAVGARLEDSSARGINGNQTENLDPSAGAVYVFTRSAGVWSQQAYVKASNTGVGDEFGTAVALSADGNTLVVGAPLEDTNARGIGGDQGNDLQTDAGSVYVFTRSGGTWTQQAYVKASNTEAGDGFGISVTLSADGNTLAVGANFEDSAATGINDLIGQDDNSALNAGAVYVFTRSGIAWSQQAYVKASNTGVGDQFGISAALTGDGNTLAVGAPREDSNATGIGGSQTDNTQTDAGAVYVFTRSGATWNQQAYVKASNTVSGDAFGGSVAVSSDGNTFAVGAGNVASQAGAVYVFARSGSDWSQQAIVKGLNTEAFDIFGSSSALSGDGNTLAVGATGEAGNATGIGGDQTDNSLIGAGAAYVFTRSGSAWSQQA